MRDYALLHKEMNGEDIYIRKSEVMCVYKRYGDTILFLTNGGEAAVKESLEEVVKLLDGGAGFLTEADVKCKEDDDDEPVELDEDDAPIEIMDDGYEGDDDEPKPVTDGGRNLIRDTSPIEVSDVTRVNDLSDYTVEQLYRKWGDQLPERHRQILASRYGFDGGEKTVYSKLAEIYGVGTERVRQIVLKCLRRMTGMEVREQYERKEKEKAEALMAAVDNGEFTWYDYPVGEALELTVRSSNCLKNAGVKTVAELCQRTEDDLWKVRNMGRHSLSEIKDKLKACGLRLGMTDEEIRQAKVVYLPGLSY